MRITNDSLYSDGDYVLISQNAEQDETTLIWTSPDNTKDSYLIEMIDSASDKGYVSIKRADATAGNITWTEIVRVNFDGTMILHEQSASIAAAAANALKLFAKDYNGRSVLTKRDDTDESNILEGKGLTRVWRQDSEPADAKMWDIWIDTSDPSSVWDDLRIVPGAFSFSGTSDPVLGTWQPGGSGTTMRVWQFKQNDQVFFTCQLPHSYKQGTDLEAHVHWTPRQRGVTESGKTVHWELDYSWADINGAFGVAANIDLHDTVDGTDDKHQVAGSTTISASGNMISSMLICRLWRNSTDSWAGASNANSPVVLEFDLHFEIDIAGSREEYVK